MDSEAPTLTVRANGARLVLGVHVLISAGIVFAASLGSLVHPITSLVQPLAWCATLLFVWGLVSWASATGTIFDLYGFFWMAACFFNAGQLFVVALGRMKDPLVGGYLSEETVVIAAYMVTLGLAFTHLGALLQVRKVPRVAGLFVISNRTLQIVGLTLLVAGSMAAVPAYLRFFNLVREGGYFAIYVPSNHDELSNHLLTTASFIVPGILFLCAGSRESRKLRIFVVTFGVLFACINFAIGMRGMAMFVLLGLPLVWHYGIRKISAVAIVAAAVVLGGVILPLIGVLRASTDPSMALSGAVSSIDPATALVTEAGFSMVSSGFTYEWVPRRQDFDYGRTYTYALSYLIPNQGLRDQVTNFREAPQDWMVRELDPEYADAGGGLGFSYLAETYLNFGWLGLVVIPAFFGYLFAWVSKLGRLRAYPGLVALAGCMAGPLIMFPRDQTAGLVHLVWWYAVAPLLLATVIELSVNARRQAREIKRVAGSPA